jgi:small subunit ribosomal protein S19e
MRYVTQVDRSDLITKTTEELKKVKDISPPSWTVHVKTGTHKARPPVQSDWWYIRAASIVLKISKLGPVGVSKLRIQYGGKKRRGHQPPEFRQGSGNIIRKILQQLEKAGLVKQQAKGVHKGRVLTPKGLSLINRVAKTMVPEKATKNAEPKRVAKPAKGSGAGAADTTA